MSSCANGLGTPDCLLTFTNPHVLTDCAFHPCVRYADAIQCDHGQELIQQSLQRWTRDKSLSFIPPDGRFILAEYRYAPNTSTRLVGTQQNTPTPIIPVTNIVKDLVPLPFTLKTSVELGDHGCMCGRICIT